MEYALVNYALREKGRRKRRMSLTPAKDNGVHETRETCLMLECNGDESSKLTVSLSPRMDHSKYGGTTKGSVVNGSDKNHQNNYFINSSTASPMPATRRNILMVSTLPSHQRRASSTVECNWNSL